MMNFTIGLEKWMMKCRAICLVTLLECVDRLSEECEGKAVMNLDDGTRVATSDGIASFLDSRWYQAIMQEVFSSDGYRVEGGRLLKCMGNGTYVICLLETEVPRVLRPKHMIQCSEGTMGRR